MNGIAPGTDTEAGVRVSTRSAAVLGVALLAGLGLTACSSSSTPSTTTGASHEMMHSTTTTDGGSMMHSTTTTDGGSMMHSTTTTTPAG
jgi:hypothetical protein